MTTDERAELRRLAEAATPGPWVHDGDAVTAEDYVVLAPMAYMARDDRDYITAANPATVLALLDQLDAAEARIANALTETETLANAIEDGWPHTPACQGEPGCPLCRTLHQLRGDGPTLDGDEPC